MRGSSRRAPLIATLLATLLVPAVGSMAGVQQKQADLQKTLDRLEVIRGDIDVRESKASELKKEIQALSDNITRLQIAMNKLDEEIAQVESDVRSAQNQIDATQERIHRIEDIATAQAVALYKSGATDTLDALLDSRSLAELNDRIAMLGVAAQQNTGALIQYGRLKLEIQEKNRELLENKAQLNLKLKGRAKVAAELEGQRQALEERYGALQSKLGRLHNKEGDLESDSNALRQEILEAQVQSDVASLGISTDGFIWPLNGAVTSGYGPRWGSMHTGIDIDGYTGQPVVSSKGGHVVMASAYSGYGNAVIVDHGGGIATLYAHLSSFSVSSGATVDQGQVVGAVGCTGSCTGDHLHFEVRVNGSPVDPMSYLP